MLSQSSDYRDSSATLSTPHAAVNELPSEGDPSTRTSTRQSGQVRRIDMDGEMDEHIEMPQAPYQPLTSPYSASLLIAPQHRVAGVRDEGCSSLTSLPRAATPGAPTTKWRARKDLPEASRRRYVDGGVRIAGGPMQPTRLEAPDLNDVELCSAASTLPPLYQPYG